MKRLLTLLSLLCLSHFAWAWNADQLLPLVKGDVDDRVHALQANMVEPNPRLRAFLQALLDDEIRYTDQGVWRVGPDQTVNAVTGAPEALPDAALEVVNNNRMRSEIESALAALNLFNPDANERLKSVQALIQEPDPSRTQVLMLARQKETVPDLQRWMDIALASIQLNDERPSTRIQAARTLGEWSQATSVTMLKQRLNLETDPAVKAEIDRAMSLISAQLQWGERLGVLFTGLSQGSILLLIAMGLAITYGLMGIINMAHGELMLIGAYATYVTQSIFAAWFPEAINWYLPAALPLAFLAAAVTGSVLEYAVLRHLYGRPLETLLATWGISLILIQAMRSIFGAQNVAITNPSWMSGSVTLMGTLTVPWNRLIILGFALLVLLGLSALIAKTRLGLFVRGVTQNRPIAACMGVNTRRIDNMAFALGSGIAGLAGCALSQIGNVGPEMGQGYIVDSFMVVVLGGVGQLAGTVYAALGLGLASKWIEGYSGAVLAKVCVLLIVIAFIQKRPQGLFALKGRSLEN